MGPSIGNEFTLCSSGGCCIGVSHGGGEGELIVTYKSGAILVYNVREKVLVTSGLTLVVFRFMTLVWYAAGSYLALSNCCVLP